MKKISIIVPVYNVEKYINRCVESLIRQTYSNIEILLIDDGSKDSSGKLCDELCSKDPRIKCFHKTNGGLADARNYGLDQATGDYIGFVDSDDYIDEDMYKVLIAAAEKYNKKIVSGIDCNLYDNGISYKPELILEEDEISKKEIIRRFLFRDAEPSLGVCNKLFNAELFKDIRFPKGYINEDSIVLAKLYKYSDGIVLCSKAIYYYCHREGSITKSAFKDRINDYIAMNNMVREELSSMDYRFIEDGCNLNLLFAYRETISNLINYNGPKERYKELKTNFKKTYRLLSWDGISTKQHLKLLVFYISPRMYIMMQRIVKK